MKPASDAIVIIPTYNEADNVSRLLPALMKQPGGLHVLFVDDASPDGTAAFIEKEAAREDFAGRIFLHQRAGKLGLGTAYIAGFRKALDMGYRYICEMDADFSHDPADVPRLIETVRSGQSDVAIGSRYHNGISIVNWPLSRLILSYSANLYARSICGLPVQDTTAGFKCFHRNVLERIPLDRIKSNGYTFQIEMHYRAWKAGFKLSEVSIIFREREHGVSKMSRSIIFEAVWMVWALKLRSLLGKL